MSYSPGGKRPPASGWYSLPATILLQCQVSGAPIRRPAGGGEPPKRAGRPPSGSTAHSPKLSLDCPRRETGHDLLLEDQHQDNERDSHSH
jgi:hypothetical protein